MELRWCFKLLDKIRILDETIAIYVNANLKHRYLDYFFVVATYLGSDIFAIGFILGFTFLPVKNMEAFALYAAISLVLTSVTVAIIKNTVKRKRPFESIIHLQSLKIGIDQYSFPSGHTAAAFSLAVTSALVTSGHVASSIYLILAFIVAASRVYLGVHYLSDVTVGALIGSFFAVLVHLIRG